jgi:hypothetical protein
LIGFWPVLGIIFYCLIRLTLQVEGLITGSKYILGFAWTNKRLKYFSFMYHFLFAFQFLWIVIGWSLIFIVPKKMSHCCIAKSFFHIVCGNILQTSFNVSLLVSSVIGFILKLFHVFKFRMFT